MSTRTTLYCLMAASVTLLVASSLEAQKVVSSGAVQAAGRDLRWDVSTNGGGSWTQAFIVVSPPGQWASGAPGGTWISGSASGSGGGGAYRVRTIFDLAVGDLLSFNLRCAVDNGAAQVFVNGTQFGTNACGIVTFAWGMQNAFTTANFTTGANTLEVRWVGDNTTDGVAVEISALSFTPPGTPGVVPEPATYALLGTGLLAMLAVRRRRAR